MRILITIFFLILPAVGYTSDARKPGIDFSGSQWIWHPPPSNVTLESFQGETIYFRSTLVLPAKPQVKSAEIILTADNLFTLFVRQM